MEEITNVEVIDKPKEDQLPAERIDSSTIIANIDAQEEILKRLIKYVQDNLKAGIDYYSIKEGQKPSLGLPGSEKINDLYKYSIKRHSILSKVISKNEVSYEMEVFLQSKATGQEVGSGVGFCSSLEDKYKYEWFYGNEIPSNMDKNGLFKKEIKGKDGKYYTKYRLEIDNHINIANTIIKMASKRAYVDATLKSTMASFIFTQDLEDGYIGNINNYTKNTKQKTSNVPTDVIVTNNKYPPNRDYFEKYDWSKVDMQSQPAPLSWKANPKDPKKKIPDKRATELVKLYFYACDVLQNKEEVPGFYKKIAGKEYGFTFEDIKKIVDELIQIEDAQSEKNDVEIIDEEDYMNLKESFPIVPEAESSSVTEPNV